MRDHIIENGDPYFCSMKIENYCLEEPEVSSFQRWLKP